MFHNDELHQIHLKLQEMGCMKKEDLVAYIESIIDKSDYIK